MPFSSHQPAVSTKTDVRNLSSQLAASTKKKILYELAI
jgi:hypothetical protein